MTVAERLAGHTLETRFEDLPGSAIDAAKLFLLDALAVGIAGSGDDSSGRVRAATQRWEGAAEASVFGTRLRLPAATAALVNAHQMHCLEFDCLHEAAVVHAMSVLTPAALAWAERAGGVGGRDLIAALVLGVDVAVTLGLNQDSNWHFFRPATAGAFGAVAAAGRLARAEPGVLANAFGVMLAQVCGTMQAHAEGRSVLPLQVGFNARNAIAALDLAQAGIEGPREVFEGTHGYFALFENGWNAGDALDELGVRFRIEELSHKPYPCGRASHGLIDGLLQLRKRHGIVPEDVERILLLGSPLIVQLVARPLTEGMNAGYARLCARYVGALALSKGTVDIADFSPARIADPALRGLAERIDVAVDQNIRGRVMLPQTVIVRLRSGAEHRHTVETVLGNPRRPLSRPEALEKFRICCRHAAEPLPPENAMRVIELVERIETLATIEPLLRLCRP